MKQELRKWYYVGTCELWNQRPVDVYEEATSGQVRLCDGKDEVFCTSDDLMWLIDTLVRAIWGWRERKQVVLWV